MTEKSGCSTSEDPPELAGSRDRVTGPACLALRSKGRLAIARVLPGRRYDHCCRRCCWRTAGRMLCSLHLVCECDLREREGESWGRYRRDANKCRVYEAQAKQAFPRWQSGSSRVGSSFLQQVTSEYSEKQCGSKVRRNLLHKYPHMARLSGLQKQVLTLYKRSLKLVQSKPIVRHHPVHFVFLST